MHPKNPKAIGAMICLVALFDITAAIKFNVVSFG